MSYGIIRFAKLKTMGNISASLGHTYRTLDTPNADPSRTHLNNNSLPTHADALQAIRDKLPEKTRKGGVLCLEYLITASPEWQGWGTDKQQQYFDNAIQWLKNKHGEQNVVMTGIQLDETTPHLVAYVIPYDDRGKMNAQYFVGNKAKCRELQTDFAANVAIPLGLDRGIAGSRAKHQSIQKYYSKMEKIQKDLDSIDQFEIPQPQKSRFGFGGESLEQYKERITPIINDAMNTLKEALIVNDSELDKLNNKLSRIEAETGCYRHALHKVGLGQVDEFNQQIDVIANKLQAERKAKLKADNLALLMPHDNAKLRSDAKTKYILDVAAGQVIQDERKYQKQVDDILLNAETVRPSDDDIKQYAFARKYLNTIADMRQSGEFMDKVRSDNAKHQQPQQAQQVAQQVTQPQQPQQVAQQVAQQVRVAKSKSDLDR